MSGRAMIASLLVAGIALIAACSSGPQQQPSTPSERQSLDRSARLAFDQGHYAQAVTLYGAALQLAMAEDDPGAIVDARFNIALCHTYLGDDGEALAEAGRAETERRRRGLPPAPDLQLLIGTIHYRADDADQARATLDRLLRGNASPATTSRAHFVLGLLAADAADLGELRRHAQALEGAEAPSGDADRLELLGRLAGLEGRDDVGLAYFDRAAEQRAYEGDYRGMARTLAGAGSLAADNQALAAAAWYYFRAGRSASQRGQPEALNWLERSRSLAQSTGDDALARDAATLIDAMREGDVP